MQTWRIGEEIWVVTLFSYQSKVLRSIHKFNYVLPYFSLHFNEKTTFIRARYFLFVEIVMVLGIFKDIFRMFINIFFSK